MISTWMLYALTAALLLGIAALALEHLSLGSRRPIRWIWLTALAGSVLLPAAGAFSGFGAASHSNVIAIRTDAIRVVQGAPTAASAGRPGMQVQRALAIGWLGSSIVLLCGLGLSLAALERRQRRWHYRKVGGRMILVSDDVGPAVIRYLWPEIVVPRWVLGLDGEAQRRLIAHEEQHERAGDPWLLLAGAAALVLMPWNLPLWWQVRRLRLAIEVDCDARVLREMPGARAYGLLLLAVGERVSRARVLTVAFSEPCSLLERRIQILTQSVARPAGPALAALCTVAALAPLCVAALPAPELPDIGKIFDGRAPVLLSAGATAQPTPVDAAAGSRVTDRIVLDAIRVPVSVAAPAQLGAERVAIWTTRRGAPPATGAAEVGPRLRNHDELTRRAARAYPSRLRAQAPAGAVLLWAHIDGLGRVVEVRIARSSGSEALDQVARETLWWADFVPAQYEGQAVGTWVEVPITFGRGAAADGGVR